MKRHHLHLLPKVAKMKVLEKSSCNLADDNLVKIEKLMQKLFLTTTLDKIYNKN